MICHAPKKYRLLVMWDHYYYYGPPFLLSLTSLHPSIFSPETLITIITVKMDHFVLNSAQDIALKKKKEKKPISDHTDQR